MGDHPDILNLIVRFFKFGMETKQFPSPDKFAPRYRTSDRSGLETGFEEIRLRGQR
jgi:hypothetical protein